MRDDPTAPRTAQATNAPSTPRDDAPPGRGARSPRGRDDAVEGPPTSRRRRPILVGAVIVAMIVVASAFVVVRMRAGGADLPRLSPLERLAQAELEALEVEPVEPRDPLSTLDPPPSIDLAWEAELPAVSGKDREARRRHVMVRVRRHLQQRAHDAAIDLMNDEEQASAVDVDGAWRSLRLRALRAAGRGAEATAECAMWASALDESHPDRAWAEAELALDRMLNEDADGAEAIASPWLGRALSPLPASRLRLAEALLRGSRGDHAVAAAALESAVALDGLLDPRAAMGRTMLLDAARELADGAAAAGELAPAIILLERALDLAGATSHRTPLLEHHATLTRADAMAIMARARDGGEPLDAERVNRRLLAAADSAREFAERLSTDIGGDVPRRRAAALFAAAECWERAGRGDEAVAAWRDWLLVRPDSDPQRAEVLWRVAETLHGRGRFMEAAEAWRQLLKAHPNSPQAAMAPIEAARSLRALGREADAAPLLDEVLEGRGGIDPDAPAFTAALVERGRLAHAMGDAPLARRRLEEALRREPFHSESLDLTLLLADSWRIEAMAHAARAASPAPPSEQEEAQRAALQAWRAAALRFAEAVARIDRQEPGTADETAPGSAFIAERAAFARLGLADALEATGRADDAVLAYEETDRRHPELEASLVALDRLARMPGVDAEAIRRRALRRVDGLAGGARLLDDDAWRAWFGPEAPRQVAGGFDP